MVKCDNSQLYNEWFQKKSKYFENHLFISKKRSLIAPEDLIGAIL